MRGFFLLQNEKTPFFNALGVLHSCYNIYISETQNPRGNEMKNEKRIHTFVNVETAQAICERALDLFADKRPSLRSDCEKIKNELTIKIEKHDAHWKQNPGCAGFAHPKTCSITLNETILEIHCFDDFRDTVLHEIGHIIAGRCFPKQIIHHSKFWKLVMLELEADASTYHSLIVGVDGSTQKTKLLDKVKKLLSLANSDNKNEAEVAAERAHSLIVKHNIRNIELLGDEAEVFKRYQITVGERQSTFEKYVDWVLVEFFFIKQIYQPFYGYRKIWFIGTESNIQIALYVREYLIQTFKRLYKEENKKQGWKGKYRDAFCRGLFRGLQSKLKAQRSQATEPVGDNNEKAIAIQRVDAELKNFVAELYPKLRSGSSASGGQHNPEATAAGKALGQSINISKGMNSTAESNGALIGGES